MGLGVFCFAVRFVPVVGNPVVLFVRYRPFRAICTHVGRGMEREGWGASRGNEGQGLGGEVEGRGSLRHERVPFTGLDALMLLLL